jgi:hypothetical protein
MDARAIEGMLETPSDIDELEQIASQAGIAGNTRSNRGGSGSRGGRFGWSASPNIERASAAREKKKAPKKKKPSKKKAPMPVTVKSPASPGRPAAVGQSFTHYSTLIETCRSRCDELALSRAELDRLSGLPEGYSAKLLGRDGCGQRQKRAWPISLEALLGALGLKVILIIDEQATARTLARREKPVNRSQQRFGNVSRISAVPALPPPAGRETLDSCAGEEATAA